MSFEIIDTKLEAYKLVHDPTRLLCLLYSKYGDIDEDYNILISNQLVYNKSSHLNIDFKEKNILNNKNEFLRRFYTKRESSSRIDKLNDYYKNYQSFFCKATLSDFVIGLLLKNYQDVKAEIFYKDNYGDSANKEENEKSNFYNSSLSSLDNITYNKTIFDKRNKQIIENCDKNCTISLSSDSFRKNNKMPKDSQNLINLSYNNNTTEISFIESIKNIIQNKVQNKKEIEKNKFKEKKDKIDNLSKKINNKNIKIESNISNNIEKIYLDKTKKDINKGDNLLSMLNFHNSLNSPHNKSINNNISKEHKKPPEKTRNSKNLFSNENNNNNNNKLYLSPQKNKLYFTNITSRISNPINIKNQKRNKSHHLFNNKKNSEIIFNNVFPNSKNSTYFLNNSNKFIEFHLKNGKTINKSKSKNNSNIDNNKMQNMKSNFSRISKYNQFLISNNSRHNHKKNQKNKTFELINVENKPKNSSKLNILFSNFQKFIQSPRSHKVEVHSNNGFGSKFNLFKGGGLSPNYLNSINRQNSNRHLNNFQAYNKLNINKTTNLNEYKKFMISSNSLENNINLNSLSPKSISSNLNINSEKNRNIGIKNINKNTNIQNNINIINKIKIQPNSNKTNKNNSNSNYNINFNNLFFYGPNTPTNCFDHIKNSIINNNQNKNLNINKINTNFYMLSFNNLGINSHSNKRNNLNNSLNKLKTKVNNNNIVAKYLKKNGSEKRYNHPKNQRLNIHEKKIQFSVNKLINGKINNYYRKKSNEKVKNIKIELNNKNKNIILD